jgi:hypothetical protein
MNVLFKNGYQQTDELEADTMGVMLSSSTGYEPHALVDLFHRINNSEKEVSASDRGVIASIELAKGSGKKPGEKESEKSVGLIGGAANLVKKGVGSVAKGVGKVVDVVEDTAIIGDATKLVKKGVSAVGDTTIVKGATGLVKKGVGTVVGTLDSTVKAVSKTASKTTTLAKVTNVSYLKQLHPPFDKRIEWIENTIESQGLAGGKYRTEKGRFVEYTKG